MKTRSKVEIQERETERHTERQAGRQMRSCHKKLCHDAEEVIS